MLYAGAMADGPKSGGRWGDLVALGIGTGLIAYFTKIRGNPKYAGPSTETWWEVALVVVGVLGCVALITYLILRVWDALMARLRRR